MANVIRIKRRASGAAGAPAALKSAELAHNEVDDTLDIGKGDDGSGNATTVVAVPGKGAFFDTASAQTIGGAKTFSIVPKASQDASRSNVLVPKSQFDTALSGKGTGVVHREHVHVEDRVLDLHRTRRGCIPQHNRRDRRAGGDKEIDRSIVDVADHGARMGVEPLAQAWRRRYFGNGKRAA